MSENANTKNIAEAGMPKAIYQDLTPEDRLAKIKETADQVVDHNYKRPYTDEGILLSEKDITQEMSQSTIFQALRDSLIPDDQEGQETLLLEAPEE